MKKIGKFKLACINSVFRTIDFVSLLWPVILVFSMLAVVIAFIYFGGLYV